MKTAVGYGYAPDADPGLLAQAAHGVVIRNPDSSSPWHVIDHDIHTISVTRWPGRLFRLEILDTTGVPQANSDAPYTRALAVRVVEELPASLLFGEHGEEVVKILSFASQLDVPVATRLAQARHKDADQAYSRAWRHWLDTSGDRDYKPDDDFSATLAAGSGQRSSPINCGFKQIHRTVWERAEAVAGASAFVSDDDGEPILAPVWNSAAATLLDAAMALGAPTAVKAEDAPVLLAAWRDVLSRAPSFISEHSKKIKLTT